MASTQERIEAAREEISARLAECEGWLPPSHPVQRQAGAVDSGAGDHRRSDGAKRGAAMTSPAASIYHPGPAAQDALFRDLPHDKEE